MCLTRAQSITQADHYSVKKIFVSMRSDKYIEKITKNAINFYRSATNEIKRSCKY